jgi:hypothetical protein
MDDDGRGDSVVASQNADHDALYFAAVGIDDARFHCLICGLEADFAAFFIETLKRGFAAVEKSDDLLAIAGGFPAFDDDKVTIAEMIFNHAFAAHAQHIDAIARMKHRFQIEFFAVFNSFNRRTGGNIA